jgi:hypothetical protein
MNCSRIFLSVFRILVERNRVGISLVHVTRTLKINLKFEVRDDTYCIDCFTYDFLSLSSAGISEDIISN